MTELTFVVIKDVVVGLSSEFPIVPTHGDNDGGLAQTVTHSLGTINRCCSPQFEIKDAAPESTASLAPSNAGRSSSLMLAFGAIP